MACDRVVANKGAPGIDGMTVDEIREHLRKHQASICTHIREGRYVPAAVRRVDIPKPDGGSRMLGIPTVQDRVIQQAIAQVLMEHYDPTFSEFSYGFRPRKSAHQAIEQTGRYLAEGRRWIVEMDLAKFFDTVNHDRLMSRLERDIADKMLLRLCERASWPTGWPSLAGRARRKGLRSVRYCRWSCSTSSTSIWTSEA